jgi:hypothetical protein
MFAVNIYEMKSITRLFLIVMTISFAFSSCSMEKRLYSSGYHFDWNFGKSKSSKNKFAGHNYHKNSEKVLQSIGEQKETEIIASIEDETIFVDNRNDPKNNLLISFNNKKEIKFSTPRTNNPLAAEKSIDANRSLDKKHQQTLATLPNSLSSTEEPKINGMALAGFICSIVGLILLLATGWPFLLGTLGTIFSIIGLKKIRSEPDKWKGRGFAIAGLIVGIVAIILFWLYIAILVAFAV